MRYFIILILALSIQGCESFSKKPDAILPPATQVVHIDPRALERCKPLVTLDSQEDMTEYSLLDSIFKNIEIYKDCANKQDVSIELLKKFSNHK
jgi:hypothetical protein